MPKVKISEYSATANSNTDVASINIDEGCAPSGINNAIRAVMGHLKDFQQGTYGDPFNGPHNGTLGATTASTANVTTLTTSSTVTHNGGTPNGVAYLNGAKVLTTGSALTFDGTKLSIGSGNSTAAGLTAGYFGASGYGAIWSTSVTPSTTNFAFITNGTSTVLNGSSNVTFQVNNADSMALTSTGLGIGTSSPGAKLVSEVTGSTAQLKLTQTSYASYNFKVNTDSSLTIDKDGATRLTLDASGNLLVNTTSGTNHYIAKAVAEGSDILGVISTTTNLQTAYFMGVSSAGENAAASAIGVRKNSSTSRSINAAGTINASGADYAEYMTKAGDFTIAKGDVVGIDAQGTLTNVFADAISFVVKSTDPSYVGGDVWGNEEALGLTKPQVPAKREATEEVEAETDEEFAIRQTQYEADKTVFDAALETARQRVDRIAFAGQVPVNVTGATAGQYIIPINDNGAIKGEAVSNPTFEQYQIAVGKVIAIESDGRAKIIVKVA